MLLICSTVFTIPYQGPVTYPSFLQFYTVVSLEGRVNNYVGSLFLLIGRLAKIRGSVCILQFHRSLCVSFIRTDAWLYIYHLFLWSNLSLLHNSQWITFPTMACLVIYSFCANLLHSLIMSLIVTFLSPTFAIIICIYSLRVFYSGTSWCSFTGVWVRACLLMTPVLFSVLRPFS